METMKKIAIIGSVGVPANYGGFETLTENLIEQLAKKYEITVFCSGKTYQKAERKSNFKGASLKYVPLKANGLQSILYDYISIIRALFYADTLLILGVSGCTLLPLIRLFTRKKIIVNIDGLEWRRKKWNGLARWFLRLSERFAIRSSHAHIADNKAIQRYTALYYGSISQVIAYGGNHTHEHEDNSILIDKYPFVKANYCIKVARIEPENNIELVLKAFENLDMRLVLVGNWENSEYGKNLFLNYKNSGNITLLNPIYEAKEIDFLRKNAMLYVHGHEAGGTNPSLVEAMCLGLPVLAFDVSFNHETTHSQASYFKNIHELRNSIERIGSSELEKNARSMLKISKNEYTWERIAAQYDELVQAVHKGKSKVSTMQKIDRADRLKLRSDSFEQIIKKYQLKF